MQSKRRIAAGIVQYNPDDIERFLSCIHSVSEQFEVVYIFDNSTNPITVEYPDEVIYITEHANNGVAYALNKIMESAQKDGFDWVVTMDQDSIIPRGLCEVYEKSVGDSSDVAIFCPQVIDTRRVSNTIKMGSQKEFINKCITSASCTSISAWEKIGKFDEWLFIDLVDDEFCKRLGAAGYRIIRLNDYVLNQEFGRIEPKSEKVQQFWLRMSKLLNNTNIAKFSYKKYVDPMRVYYTNRNIIYVNNKLKQYGTTGYENYGCKGYFGFLICFSLPSLLRAQERGKVLYAIVKGIRDGNNKSVEPWTPENAMK